MALDTTGSQMVWRHDEGLGAEQRIEEGAAE
jgi:hypothetical protein